MKTEQNIPHIKIKGKQIVAEHGDTYLTMRVRLKSGKHRNFQIEKSMMSDLKILHKYLVNKDVDIPLAYTDAKQQLVLLAAQEEVKATKMVSRCGFHGKTYVTPHCSYGPEKGIVVFPLPEPKNFIPFGMMGGTLKGYVAAVKPVAQRSRIFRVLAGAQCASILAGRLDIGQNGSILLSGKSGIGKSTLIRLVTAMVGRAKEEKDLKTFAGTEAGKEDYFEFFTNSLNVSDEVGTEEDDDDNPKVLYAKLKRLAYRFASQQGRQLSASYRKISGVSQRTWNQLLVLSGEKSFKAIAFTAGKTVPQGALRRLIDINVKDSDTLFDNDGKSGVLTQKESIEILLSAVKGIETNYGVALGTFVEWINSQDHLEAEFCEVRDDFIKAMESEDGWHRAFVRRFAVKCAAGVMGIRAEIIPCTEKSYVSSLKKICADTLKYCTSPSEEIVDLADNLLEAIENLQQVSTPNADGIHLSFDPDSSLGFLSKDKKVANIIAHQLHVLSGGQQRTSVLLNYLKAQGHLYGSKDSYPVNLPNGGSKQARCYRINRKAIKP